MLRVGIIGASGYTGAELLRLCAQHPELDVVYATGDSQAGTKATTLGNILIVAGLAFYHPGWSPKLALVVFFVLMTNPVSSHALSRAAHRIRTPMAPATVTDALADDDKSGDAEGAP